MQTRLGPRMMATIWILKASAFHGLAERRTRAA
jgi:hypothetical protein